LGGQRHFVGRSSCPAFLTGANDERFQVPGRQRRYSN
jgi:hypothetical protein